MAIKTKPYRIGSSSWFLRIPKDLVDLLDIDKDTEFDFILEKNEEGFLLIYSNQNTKRG